MLLSDNERDRRIKSLIEELTKENLDLIIVTGPSSRGFNFRYLTNFIVYAEPSILIFFKEHDPVMLTPSENPFYWAIQRSWIKDVRLSSDYSNDIVKVINEKIKSNSGRIGIVDGDALPRRTLNKVYESLPDWEFNDVDSILFKIQSSRSDEEIRLLEKAAELVDESFKAVQKEIKPGIKEYEVMGFLEGFHQGHGADQTFNLISSGQFSGTQKKDFPFLPATPLDREIKMGDVICLEMSAAYGGYWNQMVRVVSVGKENPELASFCDALVKTIKAGMLGMKPGEKTAAFVELMDVAAKDAGYKLSPPLGHFCGMNLGEGPVSADSQFTLQKGTCAIVHPCIVDNDGAKIFWGETYLVEENGARSLNKAGEELVVV